MAKLSFNNHPDPFFKALKVKVDAYFSANNIERSGNRKLHLKGLILTVSLIALYVELVFFTPVWYIAIPLCGLMGLNLASIGFNIMHEGVHASFSKWKWLNTVSAHSLNVMGGNQHFWKLKHVVNHHTYTNIQHMDYDIETKLLRVHENQEHLWFHKYQHLYWFLLYGLSYMAWIFYEDFLKYFSGRVNPLAEKKVLANNEQIIFWVSKALYVILYLVVPIMVLGFAKTMAGFFIMGITCGYIIAVVFQLAHIVEGTHFPQPSKEHNRIEQEWAIHQVETTADFATKSVVINWLLGGLNFQVEHHLFPKISHVHYSQINKMVKETCLEFGVVYLEYSTIAKALRSHVMHIYKLGQIGLDGLPVLAVPVLSQPVLA